MEYITQTHESAKSWLTVYDRYLRLKQSSPIKRQVHMNILKVKIIAWKLLDTHRIRNTNTPVMFNTHSRSAGDTRGLSAVVSFQKTSPAEGSPKADHSLHLWSWLFLDATLFKQHRLYTKRSQKREFSINLRSWFNTFVISEFKLSDYYVLYC